MTINPRYRGNLVGKIKEHFCAYNVYTKMFRIQYISDIHLERMSFRPMFNKIVRPVTGTLALAGDIGHPDKPLYSNFIEYCKKNWDDVIVVPGNHELERNYMSQLDLCNDICSQWSNVHFLHNRSVYLRQHRVNFCGTTLWTKKTNFRLHKEAVNWLNSALYNAEALQANTVVITHHMPTKLLTHERFSNHKNAPGFTADLDEMICWPVRAWICGHSHHQKEVRLQIDDPPTDEGEIVLGINSYHRGGNPEQTLAFKIVEPTHEILV